MNLILQKLNHFGIIIDSMERRILNQNYIGNNGIKSINKILNIEYIDFLNDVSSKFPLK